MINKLANCLEWARSSKYVITEKRSSTPFQAAGGKMYAGFLHYFKSLDYIDQRLCIKAAAQVTGVIWHITDMSWPDTEHTQRVSKSWEKLCVSQLITSTSLWGNHYHKHKHNKWKRQKGASCVMLKYFMGVKKQCDVCLKEDGFHFQHVHPYFMFVHVSLSFPLYWEAMPFKFFCWEIIYFMCAICAKWKKVPKKLFWRCNQGVMLLTVWSKYIVNSNMKT